MKKAMAWTLRGLSIVIVWMAAIILEDLRESGAFKMNLFLKNFLLFAIVFLVWKLTKQWAARSESSC